MMAEPENQHGIKNMGGKYLGYSVFQYTLNVETFEHSGADVSEPFGGKDWASKHDNLISRYFGE
jgi:hypothetical protein